MVSEVVGMHPEDVVVQNVTGPNTAEQTAQAQKSLVPNAATAVVVVLGIAIDGA
jgi:hypothetical protein